MVKNTVFHASLFSLALTAPTLLLAEASIYGQLNGSIDYLNTDGNGEAINVSSNNSRIGVRGNNTVTSELTIVWQAETGLRLDSQGGDLFDRDTFIGAEGNWGRARFGKFDTPLKLIRSRTDLFNNQVGDARNVVRNRVNNPDGAGRIGWDERFRNGVAYRTPTWNGVVAEVHYSSSLDTDGARSSDSNAYSASITWENDVLWLAAAYEYQVFVNENNDDFERRAARLAGIYDLGKLRLIGFFQHAEDPDDIAYGIGTRYALNAKLALKAQAYYLAADADASDAKLYAIGVDYRVAPNLLTYANFAIVENEDNNNLRPYVQGRTTGGGAELATVDGGSPSGLALGFSYRF